MFETFLNAIIISIMVSVNSHNTVLIRNDRVYRYVGNGSDGSDASDGSHPNLPLIPGHQYPNQLDVHYSEVQPTDHSTVSQDMPISQNIPESILIQMKDIRNASDFISTFLTVDNKAGNKNVYLEYLERSSSEDIYKEDKDVNEERRKLTKLPKIPNSAGCIPEMKIIELEPKHSPNELYFPSCIRVSRCSGCCSSQRLQCVPVSTSYEDISVIRVKYSVIEKRLKFEGFKVFRIEKHDKCFCDCIQKPFDCSSNQIYSQSECRCFCPNISEADQCQRSDNKFWDHNDCLCKCKSTSLCSTGFLFNNITCRCEAEANSVTTSRSDNSDYINENYRRLVPHHYVVIDKSVDTEIQVQRTKGLDIFDRKGINPDLDEDYHQNRGE